jgi:DNA-binding transcriptional LysR family regulator
VSSIFASRAIVPRLGAFVAQHSNLQVDLLIDDRRQDLIQEGIDIAIRFGKLPDSIAVARFIGRWPLIVAAAPVYLDRRGVPETPDALVGHVFVIAGPVAGKELLFHRGDQQIKVQSKGQVSINGAGVAVSAVLAGIRLAVASLPSFSEDLDTGALV